jgi:DNA polymerase III delta prime subunit
MMEQHSDDLWINKYKPNNIKHIIGNQKQIQEIISWLDNLKKNSNSLIINGNQGIGKTHIIKLILEEFNYIIRVINPNDIKDHRIFDDIADYNNYNNSIYTKINFNNSTNHNKIALIFDEIENITLNSEKKYVMNIHKENNKNKIYPLIFISNNQHSKLLNDLKKNSSEVLLTTPTNDELKLMIKKIIYNENITFASSSIYDKIIEFAQQDIRRLINLLQELSYHAINNTITDKIVDEFIEKSREKNINIGLVNSTKKLLNNYLDYDVIIKLYESEKVLLPLLIHENYIKKILNKSQDNVKTIMDILINISDSISIGDNIETSIYTDQNWYLQNIHGFYTCINTSYWINKTKVNNKLECNDIKFSADLNKTSLKNINRKNILNLSKIINNKSNNDILMLNAICNKLITTDENKLINILTNYNKDLTIKQIELCLKIDKTTEYNTLASKDKKRINKQIL